MFGQVIGQFGFFELWHPEWMVLTVLIAVLYWSAVRSQPDQNSGDPPMTLSRKLSFLTGLLILYVVEGSPLNLIGDKFLFGVHMSLMSLYYLVMPPLILIGMPPWIYRRVLEYRALRQVWSFVTNPFIAIFLFNGLLSFYHMPFIFNKTTEHLIIDFIYQTVMLITAFAMWWPIVGPVPGLNQLSELPKLAYIVVNGILLYPVCALLFLSKTLLFDAYANVPQLFPRYTPLDDQQLGGVMMKVIQEGSLGVALAVTVFQWFRRESKKEIRNPMETEREEKPALNSQLQQSES